jgi:uncharacterized protein
LLSEFGCQPGDLLQNERMEELRPRFSAASPEELSSKFHVPPPTIHDLLESLSRPGRDPREDLPAPVFKKNILKLEDLEAGMELRGTVLNVVDFGAFVDVGLKDSGLVHISQMANRFIRTPYEVVAVGDVVTVWVMNVDTERRRVSLTMLAPGTERRPERRPPQGRGGPSHDGAPGDRPPQGERGGQGRGPRRGPPQGQPRGPRQDGPPRRGGPRQDGPPRSDEARSLPPRQLPPRKPPKPKPLPTLSTDAIEGKAALRTFGELEAFFKAKEPKAPEPTPPTGDAPAAEMSAEVPPTEPSVTEPPAPASSVESTTDQPAASSDSHVEPPPG